MKICSFSKGQGRGLMSRKGRTWRPIVVNGRQKLLGRLNGSRRGHEAFGVSGMSVVLPLFPGKGFPKCGVGWGLVHHRAEIGVVGGFLELQRPGRLIEVLDSKGGGKRKVE